MHAEALDIAQGLLIRYSPPFDVQSRVLNNDKS
jgi:hypothetical protein